MPFARFWNKVWIKVGQKWAMIKSGKVVKYNFNASGLIINLNLIVILQLFDWKPINIGDIWLASLFTFDKKQIIFKVSFESLFKLCPLTRCFVTEGPIMELINYMNES